MSSATTQGFTYEFGGKTYHQKPLVIGQIEQLASAVEKLPIPLFEFSKFKSYTPQQWKDTLVQLLREGILSTALAVVLIPEGQKSRDRNLQEIEGDIRDECPLLTGVKVITDFFTCNGLNEIGSIARKASDSFQSQRTEMTQQPQEQTHQDDTHPSQT